MHFSTFSFLFTFRAVPIKILALTMVGEEPKMKEAIAKITAVTVKEIREMDR